MFEGHPLSGEYEVGLCRRCGFGFNRKASAPEAYTAYYAYLSKYATSFSPLAGADKFSELAAILSRVFPDKEAAILDAGCGAGGFLAKLREEGYRNLSALDPSPACIESVRRELNIEARVGVLETPPFPLAGFDLVISTGVLEHLLHPAADLIGLKKLLAPGGAAFVVVPDASRYVEFLDTPFQDFNIEHINHFSPGTLRSLFSRQGWREMVSGREVLAKTPKWNEPIVYGLFKPDGDMTPEPPAPGFDAELGDRLKAYVHKSSELLTEIDQRLRRNLAGVSEVVIWGAGQTTSLLLSSSILGEMKIRAVVDSNPAYAGRCLAGAPVGGPEIIGDFKGPVVVGTIREGQAVEKVIRESLQWNNPVITLQ
jgi:SAM-dependent methyltransferase